MGYHLAPLRGWHNAQRRHMTWLVPNRWLIPALPLLAAGVTGAERREEVAHGVSRGIAAEKRTSPGGALENKSHSVSRLRGLRIRLIVSPLAGLDLLLRVVPRLAPWATVWRRYAADTTHTTVT